MKKLKWFGSFPFREGDIKILHGETAELEDGIAERIARDYPDWVEIEPEKESGFHECETCKEVFDTPQGLSSHSRACKKETKKKETKKKTKVKIK